MLLITFAATAQSKYFVFIENTLKQPFSIKVDNRHFENDGKSFINIPRLDNGTYTLLISTNNSKDNKFTIEINGNDLGFALKQNANGDWVLFDINRFVTIEQTSVSFPINKQELEVKKDEVIISNPIIKQPITQVEPKPTIKNIDTIAVKPIADNKPIDKKISKLYQKERKDGLDQVYVDATSKNNDTIAIFIPFETKKIDTTKEVSPTVKIEQKMEIPSTDTTRKAITENVCKHNATESEVADFSAKLQVVTLLKIKLKTSGVVLKEKCFTVNQIKRLSVLFANDSGKLNFFKLAQTAVSDIKNFPLLEKELSDDLMKQEFRALINPQ
ncbi:MAG: DUF4476 domain-containing protein [Chitinophagaceae bacterium]